MAISISDNIKYNGAKPDFDRQQYSTRAAMKSVLDSQMPLLYFGWCLEDSKLYLYNKDNPVDVDLGKWRLFTAENAFQVEEMPPATALWFGQCLQYLGETSFQFTHGCFYECVLDEGVYRWEVVATAKAEVDSITSEEIEDLFN